MIIQACRLIQKIANKDIILSIYLLKSLNHRLNFVLSLHHSLIYPLLTIVKSEKPLEMPTSNLLIK